MNFIHKTLCFSGYHNARCVCKFGRWWKSNFYPIFFKNFHVRTSRTGPIVVPSGIAATTCDPGCAWFLYPSSSSGSHDSKHWYFWTQDDQFLWIAVPFCWLVSPILLFLSVRRTSIPLFFRPKTPKRPIPLREFHRVIIDFLGSRNTILIILSFLTNQCRWTLTWRRPGPNVLSRQVLLDLLKNLQCRKSCEIVRTPWKYATLIQLLLHRFPLLLGKTDTTWVLPLDLPIFFSLLCCHSSVPDFERNLLWPILLSSPIWSDNTDLVQDGDEYSRHFTFRISSECSITNFWVMLNRRSISSNFVFK